MLSQLLPLPPPSHPHPLPQIKDMKEYIARFGHGSAKLARQAQVRRAAPRHAL